MRSTAFVIACLLFPSVSFAAWQGLPGLRDMSDTGISASTVPSELKGVGIHEKLGGQVSIDALRFNDEQGKSVLLKDFFDGRQPVVLTLVYYDCPNLCTFVLNGLVDSVRGTGWVPGKQLQVVAVSIDPHETPALAARKKQAYLNLYGKHGTADGWHFLTGKQSQIRQLASELGFSYRREGNQYAHASAIYVLTPEGKISRYLYGIEFRPSDLKLAMLEASGGRVGSVMDRLMMLCYHYDPVTRKYSLYAMRLMRTGGAGTVLVFGAYLASFWRKELFPPEAGRPGDPPGAPPKE